MCVTPPYKWYSANNAAVANHDKTLISNSAPVTEPPTLKGYLNKYTNVAKGYNTRWFVLKNGILSCKLPSESQK